MTAFVRLSDWEHPAILITSAPVGFVMMEFAKLSVLQSERHVPKLVLA